MKEYKKSGYVVIAVVLVCIYFLCFESIRRGLRDETIAYGNYDIKLTINSDNKELYDSVINDNDFESIVTVRNYSYVYKNGIFTDSNGVGEDDDIYSRLYGFGEKNQDLWGFDIICGKNPENESDILVPRDYVSSLLKVKTRDALGRKVSFEGKEYNICGVYDKLDLDIYAKDFYYMYTVDKELKDADSKTDIYVKLKDHSNIISKSVAIASRYGLNSYNAVVNYERAYLVYLQFETKQPFIFLIGIMLIFIGGCVIYLFRRFLDDNMNNLKSKDYQKKGIAGIAAGLLAGLICAFIVIKSMILKGLLTDFYKVRLWPLTVLLILLYLCILVTIMILTDYLKRRTKKQLKLINKIHKHCFSIGIILIVASYGFITWKYIASRQLADEKGYSAIIDVENDDMTVIDKIRIKRQLESFGCFDNIRDYYGITIPDVSDETGHTVTLDIYSKEDIKKMKSHITAGVSDYETLCKEGVIMVIPPISKYKYSVGDTYDIIADKEFYERAVKSKFMLYQDSKILSNEMNRNSLNYAEQLMLYREVCDKASVKIAAVADSSLYSDGGSVTVIATKEYINNVLGSDIYNGYINKYLAEINKKTSTLRITRMLLNIDTDTYVYYMNIKSSGYFNMKLINNIYVLFTIAMIIISFLCITDNICKKDVNSNEKLSS